ncbi:MAG: hypothetical protein K0Q53_778 [Massilibacillus sp.]|jgi:hypothetical protein|nr:hypothetical protein [Massilibacillus sp.]
MPSADVILDFAPVVLIIIAVMGVFVARYLEGKCKIFK